MNRIGHSTALASPARIRSQTAHHAWGYMASSDHVTSCFVGRLALPLRWEKTPAVPPLASVDERLWFEAPCGGRDYLLEGSGHTFVGRMSAWCPDSQRGYNVWLSEMGAMSDEAQYFVRGFLSGTEPGPPADADGAAPPADLDAWERAIFRFHSTGGWNDGWATCDVCGCVLLAGTWGSRCQEHTTLESAAS